MSTKDVYKAVTDRVIKALETGVIPWRKPWKEDGSRPMNMGSKKPYNGMNEILLSCNSYSTNFYMTFNQIKNFGGSVRKGEHGHIVTLWKFMRETIAGVETGKQIPWLKSYTVFNLDQCEGIDPKHIPSFKRAIDFQPVEEAEKIVQGMPKRPMITHNEARAYYNPDNDSVNMPRPELFSSTEEYYSTLFHELTHSTGHANRCDRAADMALYAKDRSERAKEELIAEIGANFLCNISGIENKTTITNSEAYIKSWISVLRNDPSFIMSAASKAKKATDFILDGHEMDTEEQETTEAETVTPAEPVSEPVFSFATDTRPAFERETARREIDRKNNRRANICEDLPMLDKNEQEAREAVQLSFF